MGRHECWVWVEKWFGEIVEGYKEAEWLCEGVAKLLDVRRLFCGENEIVDPWFAQKVEDGLQRLFCRFHVGGAS